MQKKVMVIHLKHKARRGEGKKEKRKEKEGGKKRRWEGEADKRSHIRLAALC